MENGGSKAIGEVRAGIRDGSVKDWPHHLSATDHSVIEFGSKDLLAIHEPPAILKNKLKPSY